MEESVECTDYMNSATVRFRVFATEDPVVLGARLVTKARTLWMRWTYPFVECGSGVSIHFTCEISKSSSRRIKISDSVYLATGVWLNVPELPKDAPPAIVLEKGCKIGRRCMISAKNEVYLGQDVILGPSVLVTDHSHEFENIDLPVSVQGLTQGGTVRIERNCWIGYGAAIISTAGDLVVGRNSVVGAHSVVTRSVPPFSVVAGNPARVIKRYDPETKYWKSERVL